MTIHESKHSSNLDKRFRQLRQQIYGKASLPQGNLQATKSAVYSISIDTKTAGMSDIQHLYSSVTKIALLTSLAIGAELLLYFMTNSKIINLSF